jgi:hypothetical protein
MSKPRRMPGGFEERPFVAGWATTPNRSRCRLK